MTLSKTWLLRVASSVNADSANVAALANDVKPNVGAPSPMQLYVALAKDSTNASYATRAGSATDSTKLPLAGGTMNSSAQILMTGRRVTPAAMYYSGGLQVREAAFAGTSDGYIGMAPQIGFHWGGRVASSLALGSDNKFYQVTNGGSVNALATESYVNSKVSSGGIVAQSLGTNGYVKFSNGLIIQWGRIYPNADWTTHPFTVNFPRQCFNIIVSQNTADRGAQSDSKINISVYNWTTTEFNIRSAYSERRSGISWIAIGY